MSLALQRPGACMKAPPARTMNENTEKSRKRKEKKTGGVQAAVKYIVL
jgi:hypothetical protein